MSQLINFVASLYEAAKVTEGRLKAIGVRGFQVAVCVSPCDNQVVVQARLETPEGTLGYQEVFNVLPTHKITVQERADFAIQRVTSTVMMRLTNPTPLI